MNHSTTLTREVKTSSCVAIITRSQIETGIQINEYVRVKVDIDDNNKLRYCIINTKSKSHVWLYEETARKVVEGLLNLFKVKPEPRMCKRVKMNIDFLNK